MAWIKLLPGWFGMAFLLLSLAWTPSLYSQSLTLFDIDASAYPVMRAKFYAFDADGNQLPGLAPGDVQLREDGVSRTVTRISCAPASPPTALSSVLVMDISESMRGTGIEMAKAAARAWIEALPLGRSECALSSFNSRAYVNQDFTTDRTALLQAVEALRAGGDTDFDAALLLPPAGALEVCKRGQHRKVIVFLSDGDADMQEQNAVIAEAQRQNATIHAIMLDIFARQSLRDICAATGGHYFAYVMTEAEAMAACRHILRTAQGGAPCELEWSSDGCATSRELEMTLSGPAVTANVRYEIASSVLPQLAYSPSRSLRFGEVAPGSQAQQEITLTAQRAELRIDALTLTHPRFSILDYGGTAPPFTLAAGRSRTLRVQYAPADSTYAYCHIEVESDACLGTSFYADGGWREKLAPQVTVKVIHPNGGERLVAGSEVELLWEGVMPEEKVLLEYSVDGGANWQHISDEATGLRHAWRVPKLPSERCLLRVTADARPSFIEDMALIPPGTFRMGNIANHSTGGYDEKPIHDVTITRPFLMARTEVTQAQYEAVMGSNPSYLKGPDLPVETVSWHEAVEFCNELSRQEGLDPCYSGRWDSIVCDFTANGYRLPTEAEWEYACRAGTETDFYTGNMTSLYGLDPALDRAGWFIENANGSTHPVGEKEPNAFGLYDMHGNVWEWCWDWYRVDYYTYSPAEDPRGPASGSWRIHRGGTWGYGARLCRSADRFHSDLNKRSYNIGFRLVRTY